MVRNGKEPENLDFFTVAATFEKAITYVFAGSPFRNAEARSSTLLCSTNNPAGFKYLQPQPLKTQFSQVANTWPEKPALDGNKPQKIGRNGKRMKHVWSATR
jgi:hypothetical protein